MTRCPTVGANSRTLAMLSGKRCLLSASHSGDHRYEARPVSGGRIWSDAKPEAMTRVRGEWLRGRWDTIVTLTYRVRVGDQRLRREFKEIFVRKLEHRVGRRI